MTPPDDGQRDDLPAGTPPGPGEPDRPVDVPFDEDAAWRAIVENYGERPQIGGTTGPAPAAAATDGTGSDSASDTGSVTGRDAGSDPGRDSAAGDVAERPTSSPFDRSYLDAIHARRASDRPQQPDDAAGEEHFVPPDPPPVPRGTPARRVAWIGLFLPPLLMILAVAFRWTLPTVLTLALVAAFVGGFVYLVCTMPRDGGDGWGDGAVV